MFKITIKVYEVELGELPPTDREVLAWSDMDTTDVSWRLAAPKRVKFSKKAQKFFDGYVHVRPKYWCFLEQLNKI